MIGIICLASIMTGPIFAQQKEYEVLILNSYHSNYTWTQQQVHRFNIPMDRVPQGAELMNEPFSFFKVYRNLVITALLILGLLLMFILILITYLKELARVKNALQESNEEITQTYEELAASDEELQQQVEGLSAIQRRLRKISYEDELTGLLNKRALHKDFNAYMTRHSDQKGAVIFVDADNFKLINDTLGHSLRDEFIIAIGQQLQSLVNPSIQVYRMGGDEFSLLIYGMEDVKTIEKIAADIIKGFQKSIKIKEMLIHTSLSAGVAVFPDHGTTAEELIMRADIAMYKAKEGGKVKYVVYKPQMNQDLVENMEIQKNLRNAISKEELILYYQPQYDFKTREIIGFEALIRWDNEKLGWVLPYKFIQVAEENHTIIPIGRWVLDTACKFIKKVHNLGYKDYTMAVNISLLQIMQDDFVEMVLGIISKYDLDPGHLEVEMTETMLIQNFDLVSTKLELLREQGIRVALDDFGTGYSSLNYLNVLPINTLKIDKSFVDTISTYPGHKVIINNIISLGQGMGLKVLAEGVETEEEYDYLNENDCDALQGYLLSKPLSEKDVLKLL